MTEETATEEAPEIEWKRPRRSTIEKKGTALVGNMIAIQRIAEAGASHIDERPELSNVKDYCRSLRVATFSAASDCVLDVYTNTETIISLPQLPAWEDPIDLAAWKTATGLYEKSVSLAEALYDPNTVEYPLLRERFNMVGSLVRTVQAGYVLAEAGFVYSDELAKLQQQSAPASAAVAVPGQGYV